MRLTICLLLLAVAGCDRPAPDARCRESAQYRAEHPDKCEEPALPHFARG